MMKNGEKLEMLGTFEEKMIDLTNDLRDAQVKGDDNKHMIGLLERVLGDTQRQELMELKGMVSERPVIKNKLATLGAGVDKLED